MNYWPGTKIPKSNGNAFTSWKTGNSEIIGSKEWKAADAAKRRTNIDRKNSFTIHSKARPSK